MAAAPTVAERPNKVHVTDAGPSRKKIKIEIPKETVSEQMSQHLEMLSVEADLPGFRKGHVPRRLIEKKFGALMRKNAKEQLVSSAYSKAIEEHKIRVIGQPSGDSIAEVEVEDGKPLVFEIEVEVLPEFTLPSLENVPIKRPTVNVDDKMVSIEVEKLCVTEGRLQERDASEPGDYLTGHAKMMGPGGKVFFEQDGIVVQIPAEDKKGKGMIVGLVVDDLAKQLGSPKAGQKTIIKTTGPESHEIEDLRGAAITVEYTPARVDRIIPATIDELTARFGFADKASLEDAVRQKLQQRAGVEQQSVMRQQAAMFLLENTEMDLPEKVTAQQAARTLERRRLELMYRGMDPAKVEEQVAALRAASAGEAIRDLKMTFIMDKAAETLGIKVSEMEINGRIAQMAQERNERPEKLRQQLVANNQISGVYSQVREHKTLDAIIARAKVDEVSVEDFQKSMSERAKSIREGTGHAKDEKHAKSPAHKAKDDDKDHKSKPAPKAKHKDEDEKPAKGKKK